jgi:hypothetical protein
VIESAPESTVEEVGASRFRPLQSGSSRSFTDAILGKT